MARRERRAVVENRRAPICRPTRPWRQKWLAVAPACRRRAIGIRISRGLSHLFQQEIPANGAGYFQKSFLGGWQESGTSLGLVLANPMGIAECQPMRNAF